MSYGRVVAAIGVFWMLCAFNTAAVDATMYFTDAGGPQNWDATTANWSFNSGGPYNRTWISGTDAVLEGTPGIVNVSSSVTAIGSITFAVDGYDLAGSVPVVGTCDITTSGDSDTIDAILTGIGDLTKQGAGTLTLNGSDSHSGLTKIAGGQLVLGNSLALQESVLDYNNYGGTLSFGTLTEATIGGLQGNQDLSLVNENSESVALTIARSAHGTPYSGVLSGSGLITVDGSLWVTGQNTYSGNWLLNGSLGFGSHSADSSSTITFNGGRLYFDSGGTDDLSSHFAPIASGQIADIYVDDQLTNVIFATPLTGDGGLAKHEDGTLTLRAANTFSGDTRIASGTLVLDNRLALQSSTLDANYCWCAASSGGRLSFGSLTAVTLGGIKSVLDPEISLTNDDSVGVALSVGANNQSTEFRGILSGKGSLIKVGTGTLTLSNWNTYTGGTVISNGVLRIAAQGWIEGDILNDASLVFASNMGVDGVIRGTGTVTVLSRPVYTNTNTYTGDTIVDGGTLKLGDDTNPGGLTGDVVLKNSGSLLLINVANETYAGDVRGVGRVTQFGPGKTILTGHIDTTVDAHLWEGTLQFGDGVGKTADFNGDIILDNPYGNFCHVVFANPTDQTYTGTIGWFGLPEADFTKTGPGTLTLTEDQNYFGYTTVEEGTLHVTGSLMLGSAGTGVWTKPGATFIQRIVAGGSYANTGIGLEDGVYKNKATIDAGTATDTTDVSMSCALRRTKKNPRMAEDSLARFSTSPALPRQPVTRQTSSFSKCAMIPTRSRASSALLKPKQRRTTCSVSAISMPAVAHGSTQQPATSATMHPLIKRATRTTIGRFARPTEAISPIM